MIKTHSLRFHTTIITSSTITGLYGGMVVRVREDRWMLGWGEAAVRLTGRRLLMTGVGVMLQQ